MYGIPNIPTKQLTLADVPLETDDYRTIGRFALTFDTAEEDPYKLGRTPLSGLSDSTSLVLLRSRLFLEQRAWNHVGHYPDDPITLAEIGRVVWLIRKQLAKSSEP
jgi:hypothetical protein